MIFCPKTYSFSSKNLALAAASGFYLQCGAQKNDGNQRKHDDLTRSNGCLISGFMAFIKKPSCLKYMLVHNKVRFPHIFR